MLTPRNAWGSRRRYKSFPAGFIISLVLDLSPETRLRERSLVFGE